MNYLTLINKSNLITDSYYKDLNFIVLTNEQAIIVENNDNYEIITTD